jgi:exportin-7
VYAAPGQKNVPADICPCLVQLYGDSALSEALNIVLQLSLSIPVNELMAYPKVMRGYFPLQEILCHNHMSYLCLLESPVFIQIVSNIQYGLKWVNPPHDISVSSECASALYHIVEFRFRGSKKEVQALAALQSHIEANPQMFGQLLALLLETVVYDDCPNQWALSRPMLGLILTNEVPGAPTVVLLDPIPYQTSHNPIVFSPHLRTLAMRVRASLGGYNAG